jgi:hypothetical protein
MMTDEELLNMAHKLYARLGGFGSDDARLVRALWERWQAAQEKVDDFENGMLEDAGF